MEIRENESVRPKCPHCESVVDHLVKFKHGRNEKHMVYCCPRCHKIVGVGLDRQ